MRSLLGFAEETFAEPAGTVALAAACGQHQAKESGYLCQAPTVNLAQRMREPD
jgi:hypothetical protein